MNNYQLYRTNILLGGQMKYDLVADLVDGDMIINDIHITPISDNLPYNKLSDENLLNYDNQENIKNFYTGNLGYFFDTFIPAKLTNDQPLINTDVFERNYDDSIMMGCKRLEYSLYQKQFQVFCPVWLENIKENENISFKLNICDSRGGSLYSKKIKMNEKIANYFKKYYKYLQLDSDFGDKLMNMNLTSKTCTIHGLNVETGNLVTFQDYSLINNLLLRERPLLEFDSMIINTLKNNKIIAKQLFNFNICFNIKDIFDTCDYIDNVNFYDYVIKIDVMIESDVITESGKPSVVLLEKRDLYTNYEKIYKERVTIIDLPTNKESSPEEPPLVQSYLKDNKCVDLIDRNKINQKYIHWSLADNNDIIFNLYDGFAGYDSYGSDSFYYAHTYKTAPNSQLRSKTDQSNNVYYWCNFLNIMNGGYTDIDALCKNASPINGHYLNNIYFTDYNPGKFEYYCAIVSLFFDQQTYKTLKNDENAVVIGEKINEKGESSAISYAIILYTKNDDKKIYLFIMCDGIKDDILMYNIIDKLMQGKGVQTNSIQNHIQFYIDYFSSIQQPKLVFYTNSIVPQSAIAPENEDIDEIEYYKCKLSNYRYVLRYDGNIKPTFIDPLLNKEFNIFYWKKQIDLQDQENDYVQILKKYSTSKLPAKYPSIKYFPLNQEDLNNSYYNNYKIDKDDITYGVEYKWFNNSLVKNLPYKISFNQIDDGSKSSIDIIKDKLKTVLKNSNDETYDYIIDYIIEYIINQYNIESNIDLDVIESNKQIYKYQINMKLK